MRKQIFFSIIHKNTLHMSEVSIERVLKHTIWNDPYPKQWHPQFSLWISLETVTILFQSLVCSANLMIAIRFGSRLCISFRKQLLSYRVAIFQRRYVVSQLFIWYIWIDICQINNRINSLIIVQSQITYKDLKTIVYD